MLQGCDGDSVIRYQGPGTLGSGGSCRCGGGSRSQGVSHGWGRLCRGHAPLGRNHLAQGAPEGSHVRQERRL